MPASRDGLRVNVKTGEVEIIPGEAWRLRLRRAIVVEQSDWIVIKEAFYAPCISEDCTERLDLISEVFRALDEAVGDK